MKIKVGDCFVRPYESDIIRIIEQKAVGLYAYEWWNCESKQWVRQTKSLISKDEILETRERINNRLKALIKWGIYGINHYDV